MDNIDLLLSADPLDPALGNAFVSAPGVGGIVTFTGTVRDQTQQKRVLRLEFESYEPMALSEMKKIAQQALDTYPVLKIAIHHRLGVLDIGEIPVVIAVGAAHRGAAFAACQYCIDTLKQTVPIWKKEVFEDGAVWVAAHP
ncbi:MAG: molybdenum cofactor biosynthesis protein MoaE [Saprospiraceae bacterium]|nr:molybdenum cofactor biosynthesis protein MoaE [Saprospiraceae bacterium]